MLKIAISPILLILSFCMNSWSLGDINNLPANTWVKITHSPGDARGREVPPGRGGNWIYEPNTRVFLRYGGLTPAYSNALETFDPAALTWKKLLSYDQTYPSNRPGGGANWSMAYDSVRKAVWIMGGWAARKQWQMPYAIGSQGIWKYDPVAATFIRVGDSLTWNTYLTFDPVNNVIVASPYEAYSYARKTFVFSLSTNRWETRTTSPTPQTTWGGAYPALFDPSIGKVVLFKGTETWTYDAAANVWDSLTTTGVPTGTSFASYAYDPVNQVIIRFGGSDGKHANTQINETWIYKSATRTWTRMAAPGIPLHANALLFHTMAYDPPHGCLLLNEPDLGVWAFKYDPLQPAGTQLVGAESLVVGAAAARAAAPGPAEVLLPYHSPLNPRLLGMGDKTLITLSGTSSVGAEIMWDFDPDAGVIVKYGGCSNNISSPYWTGYGNQLDFYDPSVERWVPRRVCDVGGGARPMAGCTRSVFYDTKRHRTWFMGMAAGGPWPPSPPGAIGPYTYDIATDLFTDHKVVGTINPNDGAVNVGCVMNYDPDHDISVAPATGKIYVFHCNTAQWETRTVAGGPGALGAYARTVYASVPKVFLCIKGGRTWSYDPALNLWTDLAAVNQPPDRGCKYGLAYDPLNNVMLLVGGQLTYGSGPFYDMWIYQVANNTWENVTQSGPGNEMMLTAYDARHQVFLMGSPLSTLYAYRYKKSTSAREAAETRPISKLLQVTPNPFNASAQIMVSGPIGLNTVVTVIGINGRKAAEFKVGRDGAVWDASALPGGVYLVKTKSADGREWTARAVVMK